MFVYYIIGGGIGGALLLIVTVMFVCCLCYCARKKKNGRKGTWVNQRRSGDVTQNGHAHLNVAVGDIMSKMASMKEEGFDDPKEVLDEIHISPHPFDTYDSALSSPPPICHHDVILHALSHSQTSDEEQQGSPLNHHHPHPVQGTNGFHHVDNKKIGNGTAVVVVSGIGMEQGPPSILSNSNHADSQISFTCPPPNYDEIFQSSTTSNGCVNACHGNRSTSWYRGSGGSDSDEEVKKR